MGVLLNTLGINWKMLLAQGVNFFVLLVVLNKFVYRPLAQVIEERRKKIKLGVEGGEKAIEILKQAEDERKEKIARGERQAMEVISQAERDAKGRAGDIVSAAESRAETIIQEGAVLAERKRIEEMEKLAREARVLMREALAKAIAINPQEVDERLITQAANFVRGDSK